MQDMMGREIIVIVNNERGKAGATFFAGLPIVYFNKSYMKRFPRETQWFIFYHEIAHHRLMHFMYPADIKENEFEADCWSMLHLIEEHKFSKKQINIILNSIEKQFNKKEGRFHYSGYKRSKMLREQCLI